MLNKICRMPKCRNIGVTSRHTSPWRCRTSPCDEAVLPGRGTRSTSTASTRFREACRRFLHEKDEHADGRKNHGQRAPAQARVGPQVGDLAIVFAELLSRSCSRRRIAAAASTAFWKRGSSGRLKKPLQLFASLCRDGLRCRSRGCQPSGRSSTRVLIPSVRR